MVKNELLSIIRLDAVKITIPSPVTSTTFISPVPGANSPTTLQWQHDMSCDTVVCLSNKIISQNHYSWWNHTQMYLVCLLPTFVGAFTGMYTAHHVTRTNVSHQIIHQWEKIQKLIGINKYSSTECLEQSRSLQGRILLWDFVATLMCSKHTRKPGHHDRYKFRRSRVAFLLSYDIRLNWILTDCDRLTP